MYAPASESWLVYIDIVPGFATLETDAKEKPSTIEYAIGPQRDGIAVSTDFESVPKGKVWVLAV